ncbi:MAG: hypothetical protein COB33_014730 [Thiotrichaceae bacterium]|nr:hypothetical protein [Thiotrichaceae bacterium]
MKTEKASIDKTLRQFHAARLCGGAARHQQRRANAWRTLFDAATEKLVQ